MKDKFIITGMVVLILMIPLFYTWNDHTKWVQSEVSEDISAYPEPDWSETDVEVLADISQKAIIDMLYVLGGGWDEEARFVYRESLYAVIYSSFNNPEDIYEKVESADQAYHVWVDHVEFFIDHRLYAMYHTF